MQCCGVRVALSDVQKITGAAHILPGLLSLFLTALINALLKHFKLLLSGFFVSCLYELVDLDSRKATIDKEFGA